MVNGVGNGGSFARDAIKAAMDRQAEAQRRLSDVKTRLQQDAPEALDKQNFGASLADGLRAVDEQVKLEDGLVEGVVTGQVTNFHEIAAQVKQADLSFRFALAVRNKFIDAYRDVMRMSV